MGAVLSTACIVGGWSWFILKGTISTIWPMFGIANQLLACTALCVATTILLREAPKRAYAWTTFAPLVFVAVTTLTAGVESVASLYLPQLKDPATFTNGLVCVTVTLLLLKRAWRDGDRGSAGQVGGRLLRGRGPVRTPEGVGAAEA